MPHSFPHIHDPTVLGIELHVHPESTWVYTLRHCLQMVMECTKTWYITICLCSKKVFKLFDTLYVQCCLPLVVAQGDDTTAVQRRIFQYFTANVLLYKLDVWCSFVCCFTTTLSLMVYYETLPCSRIIKMCTVHHWIVVWMACHVVSCHFGHPIFWCLM